MARWIEQGSSITISMGPFLVSSDGVTPQTGLGALTVRVMRGSTWNARSSATATAHQENGFYSVTLNATDTGDLGRMRLWAGPASTVPVWEDFMVVPSQIYNALVAGTDKLHVDVVEWLGTAAATPTVAGVPEVDVTHWLGTAAATPTVAGIPEVEVVSSQSAARNEFADALLDRTVTEPTAIWTWPLSLRVFMQWFGALSRNKVTQTATTQTLRNDADSATIATSTHSDDGTTHTRGEWG